MENTNQGESEALKNSLINLSYQSIDRFDQTFQNILSQDNPSLHLHPLSTPVDNLEEPKLALIRSLDLIHQSLRHFEQSISKASTAATNTEVPAEAPISTTVSSPLQPPPPTTTTTTTTSAATNQSIIKLFALLRQSSLHLNSLIQSQSFIKQLNQSHHHPTSLSSSLSSLNQQHGLLPRSTYLDPSLLIENLPVDQRSRTSLPLIEALAREIGLECFRDSDDSNLLTIAGKLFVIDIEINPNPDQTQGRVNRSKFSYTFAEEEAKRDLSIDHELTHQLSNIHHLFQAQPPHSFCNLSQLELVQNSLQSFARSLRQLKELDELMITQSSSIDYFMVFRKLISDYHHHHHHQSEQEPDQTGKTDNLNPPIRVPPSGIPLTSVNQLKLDLVYHYNATHLLNDAIRKKSSQGLSISVALTPTTTHSSTQSDPLKPPPAPSMTTSAPTSQTGPKGLFTAHFYPPLACSRATAAALAEVSSIVLPNVTPSSSTINDAISRHFSDHVTPPGEISLEELLVYQSMTSSANPHQTKTCWDIKLSNWKTKQFGKAFSDGLSQVYCFLDAEDVHYGDSNSRQGFLITQVRFESLDSLLKIIKICQRQSIFNELFNSCFNPNCYLPKNHNLHQNGLGRNGLSDQERNDIILKEKAEEKLDPFKGFHASDYLVNLQNLPPDSSGFSSSNGAEFGKLGKDQDGKEEISIDLIMNHAAYSITLQFISVQPNPNIEKSGPSSPTPSTVLPTKCASNAMHSNDIREDNIEEVDDDEFRLISLTFSVTEEGSIRLISHSLFDDISLQDSDIILVDTPDPPQDNASPFEQSSPFKIAVLEDSLDRVRCLPVLLNAFFFQTNVPSFPT